MKTSILFNETPGSTVTAPPPASTPATPDVAALKQEIETLRGQIKGAQTLEASIKEAFTGDVPQERRVEAVKTLLKNGAKMTDEQVNQYFASLNQTEETDEQPQPNQREGESVSREEVERIKREQIQLKRNYVARELEESLDNQFKANKDVTSFVTKLERIRGKDGAQKAETKLREKVKQETIRRLEQRKYENKGHFDERWVREEAAEAAKSVVGDHLSVIGDLDPLGRTPETVAGHEQFLKSKPVEPPRYQKGIDPGEVERKVREFNTDALTRLAIGMDSEGETKV